MQFDTASFLRSEFGPKTWWYRVESEDNNGNVSSRSAAVAGYLEDITPPSPPSGVEVEGFDKHIQVRWDLNTEPDISGYLVYRSLCHLGDWIPCLEEGKQVDPNDKGRREPDSVQAEDEACSGPFVLIGGVSQEEAEYGARKREDGKAFYDDFTVPGGSPLCYAYLIKAVDSSQNKSGDWPIPDLTRETVVCERLRDQKPPEGAVITGLHARDSGISVEWIGAPVQDIGAFHVYRSEAKGAIYKWIGGITVGYPPAASEVLTEPFKPEPKGCDTIPLQSMEGMFSGSFLDNDKEVQAKNIYWYKVVGVDQVGNETPLKEVVPVSTFTFTSDRNPAPLIVSITEESSLCGLLIKWTPAFDSSMHMGFVVFRSSQASGTYLQQGNVVQGSKYLDSAVISDKEYWYKVAVLDIKGRLSNLSTAVMGKLAP